MGAGDGSRRWEQEMGAGDGSRRWEQEMGAGDGSRRWEQSGNESGNGSVRRGGR